MIDVDGSGSIERRELLRAAEHLGMRPVCERGVDAMFENVDADHNQRISFDEFRALVERWRKDM
jgi:Ca2+-binding EF-hand superfamily protein